MGHPISRIYSSLLVITVRLSVEIGFILAEMTSAEASTDESDPARRAYHKHGGIMIKLIGRVLAVVLTLNLTASAAESVFCSAPGGTSLLELYSSEGCSSCPPADSWLSSLRGSPGLWTDFVPVAFQVDYWDYLGWRDVLASPEYTARQKSYGRLVTPQVLLNGRSLGGIPSFELHDVSLLDAQGREAVRLPRILGALSPSSLWGLGFEQLVIDQPELDIRRAPDGKIFVGGLDTSKNSETGHSAVADATCPGIS